MLVLRSRPLLGCLVSAAMLAAAATPAHAASAVTTEVVVRLSRHAPADTPARLARALGTTRARHISGRHWLIGAGRRFDPRAAIGRLRRHPGVVAVTPNQPARAAAVEAIVPNDTGLASHAGAPGGWLARQWSLAGPFGVNAPAAWELARAAGAEGGAGVTVAVVDSGVAYARRGRYRRSPDLAPQRLRRGYDFVEDDPYPNDSYGHGTFVAGIIAAAADNAYGMVGIAYRADILPVRVLDETGGSSSARIAQGIRYAVDHGADVINASIELYDPFDPLGPRGLSLTSAPEIRSALRYAHERRVVVVAAAGNLAQADVPARRLEAEIINVGGTTEHGCLGDYSNHGPGLDLVAPGGGDDAALDADATCRPGQPAGRNVAQVTFRAHRPGRFTVPSDYRGTSMAAPHVSGTVALLLAAGRLGRRPAPETVEGHLEATARDLGAPGVDRFYGGGLVDAGAALAPSPAPAL